VLLHGGVGDIFIVVFTYGVIVVITIPRVRHIFLFVFFISFALRCCVVRLPVVHRTKAHIVRILSIRATSLIEGVR
jgi:hypothetical protein